MATRSRSRVLKLWFRVVHKKITTRRVSDGTVNTVFPLLTRRVTKKCPLKTQASGLVVPSSSANFPIACATRLSLKVSVR